MPDISPSDVLKLTCLAPLHRALGAKMVPFAGYNMPVQFPQGVLREHLHTRSSAGLFDVSHMGQADLIGDDVDVALEELVPGEVCGLKPGHIRYTQLLNDSGGIVDDLMVTRPLEGRGKRLHLVVNSACKDKDYEYMQYKLSGRVALERKDGNALLALQGPKAATVLAALDPDCIVMPFMSCRPALLNGVECIVSRCGYTGEDGFEISIPEAAASAIAEALIDHPYVEPVGLGARDSLRLESGLCLYGHDIDETTSPIEADLAWSISKRRRIEGGFPGDKRILTELHAGPLRKRIGLKTVGRTPAREGTIIESPDGAEVGRVTSGGFGPTIEGPIAMGYVSSDFAGLGTRLHLIVRGKVVEADVVTMPFVPHCYFRGAK